MEPRRPASLPDAPPAPVEPPVQTTLVPPATPAARPFAVMRTVLWSFFGVRRRAGSDADLASISLAQVIVGGIIGALVLIGCLVALVIFVTRP